MVHLVRQSLAQVNWRERKAVASALRGSTRRQARRPRSRPSPLGRSPLGQAHSEITALWRAWERLAPALAYPVPVRRLLYSTNAIGLHRTLRKSLKVRGTSLRGGGEQTAVPGAAERAGEARHAAGLGGGAAAHPAPLRGPGPGMAVNQAHTQRN
ncbi:MAG: transposase [Gemmatimonadetes bacterium]|nr:transposase [Gemmatimonadota bacterium]